MKFRLLCAPSPPPSTRVAPRQGTPLDHWNAATVEPSRATRSGRAVLIGCYELVSGLIAAGCVLRVVDDGVRCEPAPQNPDALEAIAGNPGDVAAVLDDLQVRHV